MDFLPLTLCLIFTNIFYVTSITIFWYHRREESIRKRLPIFVCFSSIANIIVGNVFLTSAMSNYFSLHLTFGTVILWVDYLFIPAWLYCNILRDIYLIFLKYLNSSRLGQGLTLSDGKKVGAVDTQNCSISSKAAEKGSRQIEHACNKCKR